MRLRKKHYAVLAIAAIAIALALAYFLYFIPNSHREEGYHVHADIALYLNSQKFDFAKKQFMAEENCGKPGETAANADLTTINGIREAIHMHDLNGNVIHVHNENATLSMFFKSIGFTLTGDCLETNEGLKYCTSGAKRLRVFASSYEIADFLNYKPHDLDKILVTYGDENNAILQNQFDSITSQACIYSRKCPVPAGFDLPPESCN